MKQQLKQYGKNLISNFLWVLSAVFWYEVHYSKPEYYRRSVYTAVLAAILAAIVCGSIFQRVRSVSKKLWLTAGLTTLGILLFVVNYFKAPVWKAAASAWFTFSLLLLLYEYLKERLSGIFSNFTKKEWVVYGSVIMIYFVFLVFSFIKSEAFYATEFSGDTIYTADSMQLVQKNVYLNLLHPENDLRQPLFAAAAAPFMGIPYLLSVLLSAVPYASIICMGTAQVLLLLFTFFLLADCTAKDGTERLFFFLLVCLMYPSILFSIMMEQYVVAVFWLVLYIYLLVVRKEKDGISLIGAAGSLLTSAVLVLFDTQTAWQDWKKYIQRIAAIAGKGIFAMLFFCRMDVISTVFEKIQSLRKFSGESVLLKDKLLQYFAFVKACFFAPDARENWVKYERMTWQLREVETISIVGLILFFMAAAGFWIGRKERLNQICAFWILNSMLILILLGWGTIENGLILYGLYYGWAFWILVYRFLRHFLKRCPSAVQYAIWAVLFLTLTVVNVKGIFELLVFARTYYPA